MLCRQDGGGYLLYYSGELQEWLNTEFHAGNTTSGLSMESRAYCADSDRPWLYYNGSSWLQSREVVTACANIRSEPPISSGKRESINLSFLLSLIFLKCQSLIM